MSSTIFNYHLQTPITDFNMSEKLCWNFRTIYGGSSRNRVDVPARRLRRLAELLPSYQFLGSIKVKKFGLWANF
jgi:hypothetical protein